MHHYVTAILPLTMDVYPPVVNEELHRRMERHVNHDCSWFWSFEDDRRKYEDTLNIENTE